MDFGMPCDMCLERRVFEGYGRGRELLCEFYVILQYKLGSDLSAQTDRCAFSDILYAHL